ncbi:MAG: acyltransferase [Flavobacterium sp.]|nr:acyltransferase [Pedobacter sp.]
MATRYTCASGRITIEDDVQIGPKINLIIENQPVNPSARKDFDLKSILIKRNVWIGTKAKISPGVTVGENTIVAAGALVNKDVPTNILLGGVPAKVIRAIVSNYLSNLAALLAMFAMVSYLRST